jgi:hypothetical protein
MNILSTKLQEKVSKQQVIVEEAEANVVEVACLAEQINELK